MAAAHEHGYPKNRQSLLGGTSAQLTGARGCGHSQPAAVVPQNRPLLRACLETP